MVCDLHTHSVYSFDGKDPLDVLYQFAADHQIGVLATTDHCDMTAGPEGISSYLAGEADRLRAFARLRERTDGPELLYGVEIGNAMDMPEETAAFLRDRQFDFVLGALHFLSDGSDVYKMDFPDGDAIRRMFTDYFQSMERLVTLGGFDSLAHLDYPVRVLRGKIPSTSMLGWRDRIDPILQLLVRKDIALEINTRGTYDWQGRVGPEDWVLRRYRELGGRLLTIGSDAHTASRVGAGYEEAAEALRRCGFDAYTIFRDRKPVFFKI